MASYLLIGNEKKCEEYIDSYILKESYKDFEVKTYEDKILIENSKSIVRSLAFAISTKKLILLRGEITIEAQNALLKNIEELPTNCTIMICARTHNEVLPTIQSRCFIIDLGFGEFVIDPKLCSKIMSYANDEIDIWNLMDEIESQGPISKDVNNLLSHLRFLTVDLNLSRKPKLFLYCKKLLSYSSLLSRNNINQRIILEKVFL